MIEKALIRDEEEFIFMTGVTLSRKTECLVRLAQVMALTKLSESTIRRLEEEDLFPHRKKLTKRAVGWLESEVQEWIRTRQTLFSSRPLWKSKEGDPDDTHKEKKP